MEIAKTVLIAIIALLLEVIAMQSYTIREDTHSMANSLESIERHTVNQWAR